MFKLFFFFKKLLKMKLVEDDTKHEGNNPEHNAVSTAGPSKEVRLNFCLFFVICSK